MFSFYLLVLVAIVAAIVYLKTKPKPHHFANPGVSPQQTGDNAHPHLRTHAPTPTPTANRRAPPLCRA